MSEVRILTVVIQFCHFLSRDVSNAMLVVGFSCDECQNVSAFVEKSTRSNSTGLAALVCFNEQGKMLKFALKREASVVGRG